MSGDDRAHNDLWAHSHATREIANRALLEIEGHEDLCAERYKAINQSLDDIKSLLKWAGVTLLSVLGIVLWAYIKQSLKI